MPFAGDARAYGFRATAGLTDDHLYIPLHRLSTHLAGESNRDETTAIRSGCKLLATLSVVCDCPGIA